MPLSNASSVLERVPGSSVLDMIGRTPLVRLHQFERETPGVELYAKAEWQNPGGSVKDRAAARMILDGEVDHIPEQDFYMAGPIEDVQERYEVRRKSNN